MGPVANAFFATGQSIRTAFATFPAPQKRGTRASRGRNQHALWARWGSVFCAQNSSIAREVKKTGAPECVVAKMASSGLERGRKELAIGDL
jgi:hypothetical protein